MHSVSLLDPGDEGESLRYKHCFQLAIFIYIRSLTPGRETHNDIMIYMSERTIASLHTRVGFFSRTRILSWVGGQAVRFCISMAMVAGIGYKVVHDWVALCLSLWVLEDTIASLP